MMWTLDSGSPSQSLENTTRSRPRRARERQVHLFSAPHFRLVPFRPTTARSRRLVPALPCRGINPRQQHGPASGDSPRAGLPPSASRTGLRQRPPRPRPGRHRAPAGRAHTSLATHGTPSASASRTEMASPSCVVGRMKASHRAISASACACSSSPRSSSSPATPVLPRVRDERLRAGARAEQRQPHPGCAVRQQLAARGTSTRGRTRARGDAPWPAAAAARREPRAARGASAPGRTCEPQKAGCTSDLLSRHAAAHERLAHRLGHGHHVRVARERHAARRPGAPRRPRGSPASRPECSVMTARRARRGHGARRGREHPRLRVVATRVQVDRPALAQEARELEGILPRGCARGGRPEPAGRPSRCPAPSSRRPARAGSRGVAGRGRPRHRAAAGSRQRGARAWASSPLSARDGRHGGRRYGLHHLGSSGDLRTQAHLALVGGERIRDPCGSPAPGCPPRPRPRPRPSPPPRWRR